MKFPSILRILSIVFAFTLLAICLLLWGEIRGFEQGVLAASGIEDFASIKSSFSVHGPNFFEVTAEKYSFIAVILVLYLISKSLEESIISNCLCLLSTGGGIILFGSLLLFKIGIDDSTALFYREWLAKSIIIDGIGLFITAILFLAQVILLALQLKHMNEGK